MIEVTPEMLSAYVEAMREPIPVRERPARVRAALAAVLAIVERDYPATEYTLSGLPEEDINYSSFAIKVAYRGRGLWAVTHHGYCLGRNGDWDYESVPSERTDEWLTGHRFGRDEALRLAREAAPKVRVNGMTAAEVAVWAEQRRKQAGEVA